MSTISRTPRRIVVLISGSGTNLQALIDAINDSKIPNAQIIRVISNRKAAYGLTRAHDANIPTHYHNLLAYKKQFPPEEVDKARSAYDAELAKLILADKPDLVACLGFMHILTPQFLNPVAEANIQVINLHPALPGQFDGIDAIERAHAAWQQGKIEKTGVMIHKVIAEVDQGQPIVWREIPFVKGEDEDLERFKTKVHEVEWGIVVDGVSMSLKARDEREAQP